VIAGPWQMATGEDRRWNVDENISPPDFVTRMMQNYIGKLLQITLNDSKVTEAFFHVQHMIAPPTLFFRPDILWKVLTTRMVVEHNQPITSAVDPLVESNLSPSA
jgi:hypothetical protein